MGVKNHAMKLPFSTVALLAALPLFVLPGSHAATPKPSAADLAFYEQTVKPILAGACFECHSHEAKKFKGGLALDSAAAIQKGGDTGPAVVPGDLEKSLLIKAVRYTDPDLQMPPKNKQLGSDQIAALEKWVKLGAPMPESTGEKQTVRRGKITEEDKQWWAFMTVKKPAVPAGNPNPIDAFILQKLAAAQLKLSPPADRVTLARRIYFDLTGLPPTPFELEQFLADRSPDAYERLVDKLLASPRYGEKQARHWLDLVRYAESDGYRADEYRQHAWRYRDYVVKSLNDDKPYDRFLTEQLAGDELYFNAKPEARNPELLVATGYFRAGIYEYNNRDVRGQWQRILEDITDTSADVFLGVGLQCARCHDHKFDPLLQKDYYRFQAFFTPLLPREDLTLATPAERAEHDAKLAKWEAATADLRAELETLLAPTRKSTQQNAIAMFVEDIRADILKPVAERTPHEHQIAELAFRQVAYEFTKLDAKLKGDAKERVIALRKKLTEFDQLKPTPLPPNYGATDVGPVAPPTLLPKGKDKQPVEPGYLSVLDERPATVKPLANSTGRRSELARWLTAPENPLTARVMVNRLWQSHFGRGLAANASDFGKLGEKPSHPELLDWLAATFMEKGWSLKAMHRLIVTSATYRQAAATPESKSTPGHAQSIDPDNRLLSHFPVRRLEAEQIRDAILAVTGQLKLEPAGGPSTDQLTPRRSIYSKWLRNAPDPLLNVFDLAEPFQSVSQRNITTTPPQALLLLNSQMMLRHARAFAAGQGAPPGADALAVAATRVVFRHLRSKAGAAAIQQLRDQADLRGEQQHRATRRQVGGRGLQIHLGLAGTGDAPEQQLAAGGGGLNRGHGPGLISGEGAGGFTQARLGLTSAVTSAAGLSRPWIRALFPQQQAAAFQPLQHRAAEAALLQGGALGQRPTVAVEQLQQLPLPHGERRQQLRRGLGVGRAPQPQPLPRRAGGCAAALPEPARRQGRFEGAKAAGVAGIRHLGDQLLPTRIHRGALQHRFDRLQAAALQISGQCAERFHHKPHMAAAAQAQVHQVALPHRQALRIGVGEDLPLPAGLQPHLQPGRALVCHQCAGQSCKAHRGFLR